MKSKFGLMWRVAVALVLVLSFSLVAAVPAAADVSAAEVTLSDYSTDASDVVYTIDFDVSEALPVGNTITVTFPTGTTVPTDIAPGDITVEDTNDAASTNPSEVTVVGRAVTMTTDTGTGLIEAGHTVEVVFLSTAGICNPSDSGDYQLNVHTNIETTDVPSVVYTVMTAPASFKVVAGTADTVTAGEAFSVAITALKADGVTTETTYTGDRFIDFSWVGPPTDATIPSWELITFTDGVGTSPANFILTKVEAGIKITADTTGPTVTGTSAEITINPGALDSLTITGGNATRTAGVAFANDVGVKAMDAYSNTKTDYTGTVTWSSNDESAELPANYTFTTGTGEDNGVHTFAASDFVLKTVLFDEGGSPIDTTITVTDAVAVVSDTMSITVNPASATALEVESDVATVVNGTDTATITVSAVDPYGNVDTSDSSTKVTVTASLGHVGTSEKTLSVGQNTWTLTPDAVGTIKIKAEDTSLIPALTYATTTVESVASVTEVWVDDDYGADNDGGHDWGVNAFDTITDAIGAVSTGGTVNVAEGTYPEAVTIDKQLTLKGANYGVNAVTGDRGAESIIDGSGLTAENSATVTITAGNVILDGFTIVEPNNVNSYGLLSNITSTVPGGEVRNNIIYGDVANFAICAQDLHSSWVISNNRLSSADNGTAVYLAGGENTEIRGNLVTTGGIVLTMDIASTTIQNNTLSNNTGSGVSIALDADGVTITGNTFSGNSVAGVKVYSCATKVSTYDIHQNNFAANTTDGVLNESLTQVDATNNWWGAATGPIHTSNPDGTGATISDLVVYTPWLTAPYAEPAAPVTTISLEAGWNLISLMLIPEDPDISTVLSGLDVNKVAAYSPFQAWKGYDPDPAVPDDLAEMNDGWGYWVDMNTAGTLTVSGYELCAPAPAVPPYYDVVVGWNLIGFKSTTSKTFVDYLGPAIAGTDGTLEAIYGYNASAGVYFIPSSLEPGYGYWLAVSADGTIYP